MADIDRSAMAPAASDLARVYRAPNPELAGHQQAEDVRVGPEGITVLCSANPLGDAEQTRVIRLSGDGSVIWERQYDVEYGAGRAMAVLPKGGFVIAGDVQRTELEYQAQLIHVDAEGEMLAARAFGPDGVTGFEAVAVLQDGSALAAGMADGRGRLLSTDDALQSRWELTLDDVDTVRGLAAMGSGFALAASQDVSTTALGVTQVALFSAGRHPQWRRRMPAIGRGEPAALASFADGLVMVGHRSADGHNRTPCWVLRLGVDGQPLWDRLIGPVGEERRGRAVAALADGGVAVACDGLRDGRRRLHVARLAADGAFIWERSYGGTEHQQDVAQGLASTVDGGFVLVGSTRSTRAGRTSAWVLCLDGDGGLLWDRTFG